MRWPGTAIWPNMSNLRFLSFMLMYTDRPSALFPRREKIFTFRESVGVFGRPLRPSDRIGRACRHNTVRRGHLVAEDAPTARGRECAAVLRAGCFGEHDREFQKTGGPIDTGTSDQASRMVFPGIGKHVVVSPERDAFACLLQFGLKVIWVTFRASSRSPDRGRNSARLIRLSYE